MGKSFHVHTDHLKRSGGKLSDFGGKLADGGSKLQSTGDRLTSHASADRSGVGSVISRVFGKGLSITGKVFGQGGRVAKGHGERLQGAGKLYEENDHHGHSLFSKLHPEANAKGPRGSAATGSSTGHGGTGGSRRSSLGEFFARKQVDGKERASSIDPKNKRCTKDPVDLATGEVLLTQTDVDLPGALPLVLSRTHLSSYRVGEAFGASWASTVDQRIEVDAERVIFVGENGVLLVYPLPTPGGDPVLALEGARHPLHWIGDTDGGFVLTDPETGRRLHFPAVTVPVADADPAVAPLAAITDRAGHRIDFDRDPDGTVTEIRHSGGYRVAVTTVDGQVTGYALHTTENPPTTGADRNPLGPSTDGNPAADGTDGASPAGESLVTLVTFGYDDDGRLTRVVNSSGQALAFGYDGAGRLAEWVDRNGMWYRYSYDEDGRCVLAEGAGGQLTTNIAYDLDARITTEIDSLGHPTQHHFNEALQVVKTVDPLGGETLTEYDGYDRLLSRTDQLGRTTRLEYSESGDLLRVTRPDGSQIVAEYNPDHLPVTVVDPDGAVWHRTYNEAGNLVTATDPAGAITRYDYDPNHHIAAVTNPLGAVVRITCNPLGLPATITEPTGGTTHYTHDAFGRVTHITDPLGGETRLQWTIAGNLAARTEPDGSTESWTYDAEDNLVEHVDALGQSTRTEYAGFDLPVAQIDAVGARTEYGYDTELRLTAVTNPSGLTWRYTYDAAGNLISETDVNGITTGYQWDAAAQLSAVTNALGETTTMVRDVLGRVAERHTPDGVTTLAYDEADRLIRATNQDADLVLTRDVLGQVTAEICNGRALSSTFDLAGQRIRRVTPTGAITDFVYGPTGQLSSLRTAGNVLDFDYDVAGRETRRQFGATTLAQTWDANHRLHTQAVTVPGQAPVAPGTAPQQRLLQRRSYNYRDDGGVTDIVDQLAGVRHFDLDPLGRVTAVQAADHQERYTYDQIGNLTASAWPDPAESGAAGPRTHTGTLVRAAGRVRYEHDALGRITARHSRTLSGRDRTWRYTWNTTGQLTAVTTPDNVTWRYTYDALGRRIAKLRLGPSGDITERVDFTWDGTTLAEQTHSSGHATTWEYQPDTFTPLTQTERAAHPGPAPGPDGTVRNAPQEWIDQRFYGIVTDLIGTPTELLDPAGNLAWRQTTTVWGAPLLLARQPGYCPLRFPGQYYDPETGDHYNYHRHYDPTGAAYTTPDPLGLDGGPNPHAYVPNPQTWLDPLGLTPCKRKPWQITPEGTAETARHRRFGNFYKSKSDGLWWSKDNAGHGNSVWKVFRETDKGLDWIADADEHGDFIKGKHKGPTGLHIPKKELGRR